MSMVYKIVARTVWNPIKCTLQSQIFVLYRATFYSVDSLV